MNPHYRLLNFELSLLDIVNTTLAAHTWVCSLKTTTTRVPSTSCECASKRLLSCTKSFYLTYDWSWHFHLFLNFAQIFSLNPFKSRVDRAFSIFSAFSNQYNPGRLSNTLTAKSHNINRSCVTLPYRQWQKCTIFLFFCYGIQLGRMKKYVLYLISINLSEKLWSPPTAP